jgi:membrane-associated phospholipid phosphatase
MRKLSEFLELFSEIEQFTYAIGFFSELMVCIVVLSVIYAQVYNHLVYLVGFVVGTYFNRWLKNIIQDKRPNKPVKFLASESFKTSGSNNFYGMPSGHSQHVSYSIMYLYLTTGEWYPWVFICIVIGLLMLYERWLFRNHTFLQLMVSVGVGIAFAHFVVYLRDLVVMEPIHKQVDTLSKLYIHI